MDEQLVSPDTDTLAVKQLLMDLAKIKKNSTNGSRQPDWLAKLLSDLPGAGDLANDSGDEEIPSVLALCDSSETQIVPQKKRPDAPPPAGWQRIDGTRVLLRRVSEASASSHQGGRPPLEIPVRPDPPHCLSDDLDVRDFKVEFNDSTFTAVMTNGCGIELPASLMEGPGGFVMASSRVDDNCVITLPTEVTNLELITFQNAKRNVRFADSPCGVVKASATAPAAPVHKKPAALPDVKITLKKPAALPDVQVTLKKPAGSIEPKKTSAKNRAYNTAYHKARKKGLSIEDARKAGGKAVWAMVAKSCGGCCEWNG